MIIGNVRVSESGSSRQLRCKRTLCFVIGVLSLHISCGLTPRPLGATSYGHANDGLLFDGVALPEQGVGFMRARRGEDTRWATPLLSDMLQRSALEVARAHPGGAPLVVGDLSARGGGRHTRHGSHRTGRDADLLFYLLDPAGRSRRGSGYYAFDQRGVGSVHAGGALHDGVALFDTARNWTLVRTLVLDDEAPVQWIFCADGIKARLLSYAALFERDPRALVRAAYVLHQPTGGNPHRDHFHVRIACTARERLLGCRDDGPLWPWHRLAHEKPGREAGRDDDASLVEALLADAPRSAEQHRAE